MDLDSKVSKTPAPTDGHAHHHHHHAHFPMRAKPEFYSNALYKILTKAKNQAEAFSQAERVADKIQEAQEAMLRRTLTPEEVRVLKMRTLRDMRISLCALSAAICGTATTSETQVRRTQNLPYLQWRIEKEILTIHWNCTLRELDDRQVRSGMRMPRFLSDSM